MSATLRAAQLPDRSLLYVHSYENCCIACIDIPLSPTNTDLPCLLHRAELYKQYLMYSMSGDVVELPVGGVIRKKNSAVTQQAEMQRLSQLGDILGMSPLEVNAVQRDLASQAFKQQVRHSFVCMFGGFSL